MFIINLQYIKEISEVDNFVAEHRIFLEKYYESGKFLLSGRKEPRNGGIIIAQGSSRSEIESIIYEDPFHREKIAKYEIIEFIPSMTAPEFGEFKIV
jgi:uncharacterized protein YciI